MKKTNLIALFLLIAFATANASCTKVQGLIMTEPQPAVPSYEQPQLYSYDMNTGNAILTFQGHPINLKMLMFGCGATIAQGSGLMTNPPITPTYSVSGDGSGYRQSGFMYFAGNSAYSGVCYIVETHYNGAGWTTPCIQSVNGSWANSGPNPAYWTSQWGVYMNTVTFTGIINPTPIDAQINWVASGGALNPIATYTIHCN